MTLPRVRFLRTLVLTVGLLGFFATVTPSGLHARAAAQGAKSTGDWIYLGVVADTAGAPSKWLGDTGFEFAPGAKKGAIVPLVGDRLRLTTVKQIRRANAQGQRPFERELAQGDTVGEFPPGTILKVLEIGRRPASKAGDRWQCWVRVQR
jgi:hypothetical protein